MSVTTSTDKYHINPLSCVSLSNHFVDRKILLSKAIGISKSVIKLVHKRPKNRLKLILFLHKKYLKSKNVTYLVTFELIDRTFIHLISEFS